LNLELKVIAIGSLTVPCGGVTVSVFVSVKALLFLTILLPKDFWKKAIDKIVSVGHSLIGAFNFVLNALSICVFQIKEFIMKYSFALKAFVWCVAAFLGRLGCNCFPIRGTA